MVEKLEKIHIQSNLILEERTIDELYFHPKTSLSLCYLKRIMNRSLNNYINILQIFTLPSPLESRVTKCKEMNGQKKCFY